MLCHTPSFGKQILQFSILSLYAMVVIYPNVLVVGNNSFSKTSSNGRTLGNLFRGWPKECLAQFCLSSDGPDFEICRNYYCVSDRATLQSLLRFKPAHPDNLTHFKPTDKSAIPANRILRTPIKSLLRHFMWSLGVWRGNSFWQWLDGFSPAIVLLQNGDTAFMHDISLLIAKRYHAKLVFFNTEGIYFMKKNYLPHGNMDSVFFPIYRHVYNHSYSKAMHEASYAVYLNDMLKEDNDAVFDVPSDVIYTSSSLHQSLRPFNNQSPVFVYFGNFGFNRPHALLQVAKVLKEINPAFKLQIYGQASTEIQVLFHSAENVVYHGFVNYDTIVSVIDKSDVLFHVESQEERFSESLRYGFTTKIADCLASGKAFVYFASPDIAGAKYLKRTGAGWVVSTEKDLKTVIVDLLKNPQKRIHGIEKSVEIAKMNHNIEISSKKFQSILQSLN